MPACARDALPVTSDGGTHIVTGGETCDSLRDRIAAWGASHAACTVDADCRSASTSCGLPYSCGTYVNIEGATGLAALTRAWNEKQCGANIACEPCPLPVVEPPACNQGRCGPRVRTCDIIAAEVSDYLTTHRSCLQDTDCAAVYTQCGLPGVCGTALRADATAALQQLVDEWTTRSCFSGKPCPDCAGPGRATCADGACTTVR